MNYLKHLSLVIALSSYVMNAEAGNAGRGHKDENPQIKVLDNSFAMTFHDWMGDKTYIINLDYLAEHCHEVDIKFMLHFIGKAQKDRDGIAKVYSKEAPFQATLEDFEKAEKIIIESEDNNCEPCQFLKYFIQQQKMFAQVRAER